MTRYWYGFAELAVLCAGVFAIIAFLDSLAQRVRPASATNLPATPAHGAGTRAVLLKRFWLTFVTLLAIIWFWTVANEGNATPHFAKPLLFLLLLAAVLLFAFFLEGLEIAYTELHDKEEARLTNGWLFAAFKRRETESYEAREWCMVVIVVFATLMVERETYLIPFLDNFPGNETTTWVLRVLVTFGLTTFPLIWIAQSPAKELAARNSDKFLNLALTDLTAKVVFGVRKIVNAVSLKKPSDLFTGIYERIDPELSRDRNLPPGEIQFFTDSLKKYGYAVIIARDAVHIREDGSCHYTFTSLVYIASPVPEVTRSISFGAEFVADPEAACNAYSVEPVAESVKERLKSWFQLFDTLNAADDLNAARPDPRQFVPLDKASFKKSVCDAPASAEIDPNLRKKLVTLRFPYDLPWNHRKEAKAAALLYLRITGENKEGAFKAPSKVDLHEDTEEFYFKDYPTPCLRAEMEITVDENSVISFASPRYSVTFDRIQHKAEADRFAKTQFQLGPLDAYNERDELGAGVNQSGKRLSIFVESPLPGAIYETRWQFRNVAGTQFRQMELGLVAPAAQ